MASYPYFPNDAFHVIKEYAAGNKSLRDLAVSHHRHILVTLPELRYHPAQQFMSEIDTPVPDGNLRAKARKILLSMENVAPLPQAKPVKKSNVENIFLAILLVLIVMIISYFSINYMSVLFPTAQADMAGYRLWLAAYFLVITPATYLAVREVLQRNK